MDGAEKKWSIAGALSVLAFIVVSLSIGCVR
jgi:hypothetical protein